LHVETSGCRPQGRPARSRRDPRTAHLRLARLVRLPYRYRLWRARHIRFVFKDLAGRSERLARDDQSPLVAAPEWLFLAQDVCEGRSDASGVSAGWSFEDGSKRVLPADDPKEFAKRVLAMLRDRNFRSALAIKARAAAKANYTWEMQLAPLDRMIERHSIRGEIQSKHAGGTQSVRETNRRGG